MNDTANIILTTEEYKAKLDRVVKQIFVNKQILARIIKKVVPEFENISLEDIENKYIFTDDKTISGVPVGRNLTNAASLSTEDTTTNEGIVYYDLLFKVAYPGRDGQMIGMYINIELQQDYYPGYALETRAAYYAARRLSSQLPYISQSTNYSSLQKIYSIWICMGNVPAKDANTISLYRMEKCDILGSVKRERELYDLMNFVLIRFNDDVLTQDDLIHLLQTICSNKVKKREKLSAMEKAGIRLTEDVQEGVNRMCNYGDMIEARAEMREKEKIALELLHDMPIEKVSKYTQLSVDALLKLAKKNNIKIKSFA